MARPSSSLTLIDPEVDDADPSSSFSSSSVPTQSTITTITTKVSATTKTTTRTIPPTMSMMNTTSFISSSVSSWPARWSNYVAKNQTLINYHNHMIKSSSLNNNKNNNNNRRLQCNTTMLQPLHLILKTTSTTTSCQESVPSQQQTQSQLQQHSVQHTHVKDDHDGDGDDSCKTCLYTGVITCTGLSVYFFYMAHLSIPPPKEKTFLTFMSGTAAIAGMYRWYLG